MRFDLLIWIALAMIALSIPVSVHPQNAKGPAARENGYFAKKNMHNPFLTIEEENSLMQDEKEGIDYLTISAIFYIPGRSTAIINGRIVREQDLIDNKQIFAINRESVILRDARNREYVVKVKHIIDE